MVGEYRVFRFDLPEPPEDSSSEEGEVGATPSTVLWIMRRCEDPPGWQALAIVLRPVPEEPGGLRLGLTIADTKFIGMTRDVIGENFVEPVVDVAVVHAAGPWQFSDASGLSDAVGTLQSFQDWTHTTTRAVVRSVAAGPLGLSAPFADVAGAYGAVIANPVDVFANRGGTILNLCGILAGTLLGHPQLALACMKKLLHQEITHGVTNKILDSLHLRIAELPPPELPDFGIDGI